MVGRPVLAIALLGIALLVAPASSLAYAPALDALRVTASQDGLAVDLDVGAQGGSGTLLVTRRDARGETVVDRLVPFTVDADARATIEIAGLRAGETFEVRAVAEEAAALLEGGAAVLANATRALAASPLASASLAPAPVANLTRAFPAFRVADDRGQEPTARVLVLANGVVVVAYMEILSAPVDPLDRCVVRLAASRDGGRTFGPAWDATEETGSPSRERSCVANLRWAAAGLDDGSVALVDDMWGDGRAARFTVHDPLGAVAAHRAEVPGLDLDGPVAAVALPGSRTLLAEGRGAEVRLVTLGPSGETVSRAQLSAATWSHVRAAAGADGTVALAWDASGSAMWAASRDGGRTFSAPREIPLPPDARSQVEVIGLAVGETGTLHAGVVNSQTGDAFYARIPREGNATLTPLCGPRPGAALPACERAQYPTIAAGGGRVWLWFQAFSGENGWQHADAVTWRAIESADDGATFDRPYRLKDFPGTALSTPYDASVFPDGRPIFLGLFFFDGTAAEPKIGVVPAFDPFAARSLAKATNAVVHDLDFSALPLATTPPRQDAGGIAILEARVGDGPGLVHARVQNLGATPRTVTVTLDGADAESVEVEIAPKLALTVDLRASGLAPGSRVTVVAVAGDARATLALDVPAAAVADPPPQDEPRVERVAPTLEAPPTGTAPRAVSLPALLAVGAAIVAARASTRRA